MQDFRRTDSMTKTDEFIDFNLHSFDLNKFNQSLKVAFHDEDVPYNERASTMSRYWQSFATLAAQGDFNDIDVLSKALYKESLFLVLNGEWPSLNRAAKTHLKNTLQNCVSVLNDHPLSLRQCQKLSELVTDPWGSPELRKVLYGEHLDDDAALELCVSETPLLLELRLEMLCQSKCEDLALNLSQICSRCINNACDRGAQFRSTCVDGQDSYFIDIHLLLLHKFKKVRELINEVKKISFDDLVILIKRLLDRADQKDAGRIWKSSVKLAEFISQYSVVIVMSEPISAGISTIVSLWCDVLTKANVTQEAIEDMIRKLAGQYASSAHVYIFVKSILEKFKTHCKTLCIELYIRALTNDINSLETVKVDGDSQALKSCEIKLAEGFMCLSNLLSEYNGLCRECVLTAFSLDPTHERYKRLQELAGVDTNNASSSESKVEKDCANSVGSDILKSSRPNDSINNFSLLDKPENYNLKHDNVTKSVSGPKSTVSSSLTRIATKQLSSYSSHNTQDSLIQVRLSNVPQCSFSKPSCLSKVLTLSELALDVCRAVVKCDPELCSMECCCDISQLCHTPRLLHLKSKITNEIPASDLYVENTLSKTGSADSLEAFRIITHEMINDFSERQLKSGVQKKRRTNVNALVGILGQQITESMHYDALQAPSQILEAENLGLSKQLCDDLAVVLSGPRWHFLSWALEWSELGQLCQQYLHSKEDMKNLTKELKFLEPDFNYYNIPDSQSIIKKEDEYAGIEKGYEHFIDSSSNESTNIGVVKKRKSSSSKPPAVCPIKERGNTEEKDDYKAEKKIKLSDKKKVCKSKGAVRKRTPSDTSIQLHPDKSPVKPQLPSRPNSALDMTSKGSNSPAKVSKLDTSAIKQSLKMFKSPQVSKSTTESINLNSHSKNSVSSEPKKEVVKPKMNTMASLLNSVIEEELYSSNPGSGQCVRLSSKISALKQQSSATRAILNPTLNTQNLCGIYHSSISKSDHIPPVKLASGKSHSEIKNSLTNTHVKKYCNPNTSNLNTPLSSLEQSPGMLLGICLRASCHVVPKSSKSKKSTNRTKSVKKCKSGPSQANVKSEPSVSCGGSSSLKTSPALPRFQHAFMSKAPFYPIQNVSHSDGKNSAVGSKKVGSLEHKSNICSKSVDSKVKKKLTTEVTRFLNKGSKTSIDKPNGGSKEGKSEVMLEKVDTPLLAPQVCLKSNVTNPSVIQRMHWYKKDDNRKPSALSQDTANKNSDFLLVSSKQEKSQNEVREVFTPKLSDPLTTLNFTMGKLDCRSSTLKEVNKFTPQNVYHVKPSGNSKPEDLSKSSIPHSVESNRTEGLLRKLELDVMSRLTSGLTKKVGSASEEPLNNQVKGEHLPKSDSTLDLHNKYPKPNISYSTNLEVSASPSRNIISSPVHNNETQGNNWGTDDKSVKTESPILDTVTGLGSSSTSLQDQLREFENVLNKVKSDKLAEAKKAAEARERQALLQNQLVSVNFGNTANLSPPLAAVTTVANLKLPGNQVIQKIPAQIIYSPTGSRLNILGHSLEGLVGTPGKKIMVNLVAMPAPGSTNTKPITTATKLIIDPSSSAALNTISKMSLNVSSSSSQGPEVPPVAVVKTTSITSGNSTVIVTTAVMTTVTSVSTSQNSPLSSSVSVSSSSSSSCSPHKKPCSPAEVKIPAKCAKTPPPCLSSNQKPKTPPRPIPPKPNQVQDDPETIQKVQAILEEYKREQMKLPPEEQMKPAQRRNAFSASSKSLGKSSIKKKSPSKCIGQNSSTVGMGVGQPCSPSSSVASTSSDSSANLNSSSESMFGPSDLTKVSTSPTHLICAAEDHQSDVSPIKEADVGLPLTKVGSVFLNSIKAENLNMLSGSGRLPGELPISVIHPPITSSDVTVSGNNDSLPDSLISPHGTPNKTFQQSDSLSATPLTSSHLINPPKKTQDPFDHFVIINPSPSPSVQQCSPTVAVVPGKASNIKLIDLWENQRNDTLTLQDFLRSGKTVGLGLLQTMQTEKSISSDPSQDGLLAKLLTDKMEEVSSNFKHPILDSTGASPSKKTWEGCDSSDNKESTCNNDELSSSSIFDSSSQGINNISKAEISNPTSLPSVIMGKPEQEMYSVKTEGVMPSYDKLVNFISGENNEVTNGFDCDEIREICKEQGIVTPMDESPPCQMPEPKDLIIKPTLISSKSPDSIFSISDLKDVRTSKTNITSNINLVQIDIPKSNTSDLLQRKVIFKTENPLSNPPNNDLSRSLSRGDKDDALVCKNIVLGCSVLPKCNISPGIESGNIHVTPINTDRSWGNFPPKLGISSDSLKKPKVSCSATFPNRATCSTNEAFYVRKAVSSENTTVLVRTNDVTNDSILKKLLQPSQPRLTESSRKCKDSSNSLKVNSINRRLTKVKVNSSDSTQVKEENSPLLPVSSNGVNRVTKSDGSDSSPYLVESYRNPTEDNLKSVKSLHASDKLLKTKKVVKTSNKCSSLDKCDLVSEYLGNPDDKGYGDFCLEAESLEKMKRTNKASTQRKRSSSTNSKSCACSSVGAKLAKLEKKRKK